MTYIKKLQQKKKYIRYLCKKKRKLKKFNILVKKQSYNKFQHYNIEPFGIY